MAISQAKHFIISGKIQGVFYRQSTVEKAKQLGLTGWVRNCDNGDVEVTAFGSHVALNEFEQWLWQGPQLAVVDAVQSRDIDFATHDNFIIRR